MKKTVWIGSLSGPNLKSKIQNLKWLGLFVFLVGCVGMAEAQQRGKVPRIGFLGTLPLPLRKISSGPFAKGCVTSAMWRDETF